MLHVVCYMWYATCRIGRRIGCSGRKGVCINFITADDVRYLRDIEQFYSTEIEELPADCANLL